jgi:hypothetical protein
VLYASAVRKHASRVEKRRLPVLKEPAQDSGEDAAKEPERPPWHWVGFGTAATFGAWLPLAYLAEAVRQRIILAHVGPTRSLEETQAAVASLSPAERTKLYFALYGLPIAALLVAAFFGGFLVGRWGKESGVREAALAGVATSIVVCVLYWTTAGLAWAPLLTFAVAVPMSALGGRIGIRRRPT